MLETTKETRGRADLFAYLLWIPSEPKPRHANDRKVRESEKNMQKKKKERRKMMK